MTDRLDGFLVTLEKPMRDDDASDIAHAILQLRGVLKISNVPSDINSYIAQERAKQEILDTFFRKLA